MNIQKRQELFLNPTKEYRGKPFWSWNGKLEKKELLSQIDIMKQMGFGGYFMHSRTGLETEYLGKEWFDLTNDCADYGLDTDMESWLYDEDRWPSGTAGGLVTKEEKFRAMFLEMKLYTNETFGDINWSNQIVIAFGCCMEGVTYTKERVLKEGDMLLTQETAIVFQTRYSDCRDFYNGYAYLDTMNRDGVNQYISVTHQAYKEKCENRIGTSIKGIFTDEPNRGPMFSDFSEGRENAVPYTPELFKEFERRFGYDLKLHLLELFLLKEGKKISKVTRDYIELCQELFLENFASPIQEWCHNNNMIFTGHVLHEDSLIAQTVMQGSLMRFYEYMDYPGIDVLAESNNCYWIVKQINSVARQLNKKWILSELYGGTGWQMNFESYKNVGVWQSLFGVNLRCPHLSWYTMKGEAKRDYPASILHQSAWYEEFQYIEDYFSRIHVALFDGKPCCQLLVLNPIESIWARAYSTAFQGLETRDEDISKIEKQYEEVFDSLVRSRIDFDYGEEDILLRHGHVENGLLYVGQCSYSKVLVAGMEIMRLSTLVLLEKFKKQGGEVIFAGEVPEYVDALPSKEVIEFSKLALRIPFDQEAIARYCSTGNEITVEGDADKDIFAQVQVSGDDRIVMLLNINRDISYQNVLVGLGEGNIAEIWDAKSGKIYHPEQHKKNGKIYVKIDIAKGEEKLFVIVKKNRKIPFQEINAHSEIMNLPEEFRYHLSEKNICVIDMVRVIMDKGETIECQEVLKADYALRELLHIPYRGGEMIQPWFQLKYSGSPSDQLLSKISLEYNFEIETLPKDVMLVMEDMEHITEIKINGMKLVMESVGKWIDLCFDKITIPDEYLKKGINQIVIQYDYYNTGGIEAVYLLGDFGVALTEGKKAVLTTLPLMLKVGDITKQGLPFYSGKISYIMDDFNNKKLRVKVADFEGSCVKLIGDNDKLIAWPPYCADVNNLTEIQVVLTRRNTFGPLHQLPARTFAYAPSNFVTTGSEWSDAYILLPQGLMKAPQIWEEK